MTLTDLRNVGEACFGPRWQQPLARAIGCQERLVRFWVAGDRPLPGNLAERLDAMLISRITALMAARRALQQTLKQAADD